MAGIEHQSGKKSFLICFWRNTNHQGLLREDVQMMTSKWYNAKTLYKTDGDLPKMNLPNQAQLSPQ